LEFDAPTRRSRTLTHDLPSPSFSQEVESAMSEREKLARSVETLRHRSAAFQKH